MISSNNVSHPGRVEAKGRPIALHQSALTPEEYDYYMVALSDLSLQNSDKAPRDYMEEMNHSTDPLLESKVITLREARAWLRGRFHSVPCAMVDEILHLFPSPLTGEKILTDGQFLATLRLMCHAQNGMTVLDKNLTFKPASIAVPISSGTIHPAKGASDDEIAATSPVNQSKNADVDISALCQVPVKRNARSNASTAVVAATPNQTGPATRPRITAAAKAPLKKLVPEKRAIDVESEDDNDSNVNVDEKPKKNAKPAQESQTESRSQGTGSPAKKARRTNAGKRKSDATWDKAAAKSKGPATSMKGAPSTTSAPTVANKPTTATTATAPSVGPNLAQQTIKKPFQYYAAAAPVPMPHNTRIIRPPPLSQFALRTKNPKLQEEGKEESDCDLLDSYSVPKPRAKFRPKITSNSAAKASSKLKSDEQSQDSDEDPNKTESDGSASGDSDSDTEKKTVQKPKTTPSRLAATARGTKKPTSGTIKPATRSTYTARSKKVNGKQTASDGFSRPPATKDGAYLIDRITASRTSRTGAVELNVVWEGYPESESTWEPLAGVRETEAYARWTAMWARLGKKGIKDMQIVNNMRKVLVMNGKKEEHKLVQAVGTNVNKARWVPVKEAREMMSRIKKAILEDARMMAGKA